MKKLKAAVIGLGMGRGHIQEYKCHPDTEVVALADTDQKRLHNVGKEFGIKNLYASAEKMLSDISIDVVSVAVPNYLHKDLSIMAMRKGVHVLCEKPMAMNTQEAQEMLNVSKETGRRLMLNYSYRFIPELQALKQQSDNGKLGEIYSARSSWHRRRGVPGAGGWFTRKELSGGGPLIDLGVHRLDLALWLMDYPEPEWVLCACHNKFSDNQNAQKDSVFDVEDFASGFIRFKNGGSLHIEASWAGNIQENELMETRLWGTKGGLLQTNLNGDYQFKTEMYTEENGALYDIAVNNAASSIPSANYHFCDSIINSLPHSPSAEEGLKTMIILDALYKSAETGCPVSASGEVLLTHQKQNPEGSR